MSVPVSVSAEQEVCSIKMSQARYKNARLLKAVEYSAVSAGSDIKSLRKQKDEQVRYQKWVN